ncbi:hypothetical protein [Arcobacter cloacae]|uniref:Uncharacterized protein n=1 Tax=Arcobacter cloacae TaxID=1054034 RepID=A0A6M8N7K4_9BACT|nr:hypothetical protein [Arcobacter cloacae]QKF90053.1 hypothetical protein ACLO_1562 [Arcobacter cloacae]RXI39064.1 hypothetical protein CP963_10335 [Arcobacter cloacae]
MQLKENMTEILKLLNSNLYEYDQKENIIKLQNSYYSSEHQIYKEMIEISEFLSNANIYYKIDENYNFIL